jgi:hypothetical protein
MTKNETDEVEVIDDVVEVLDDEGKDTTDWKAEAEKYKGIAQRQKTKLEKAKEAKPEHKEAKPTNEGLDRVDKLFLRSEKITSKDEIELVETMMKETGKSVEEIFDTRYFQSELKALREDKATKEATPSGTKRSGGQSQSEVDYWVAKGELPKDFELSQKVVEAKRNKFKSGQKMFSDDPIA